MHLIKIVFLGFTLGLINIHASDEKSNGGFGNGGELLDFKDHRDREKTIIQTAEIENLRGYENHVRPMLERLYKKVHGKFAQDLEAIQEEKSWWFVGKFDDDIKNQFKGHHDTKEKRKNSLNYDELDRVGYQDDSDVELLKAWFEAAAEVESGGLIAHELVVGWLQKVFPNKGPIKLQEMAQDLMPRLFFDKSLTTAKLLKLLKKRYHIDEYTQANKGDPRRPQYFAHCFLDFKINNAARPLFHFAHEFHQGRFNIVGVSDDKRSFDVMESTVHTFEKKYDIPNGLCDFDRDARFFRSSPRATKTFHELFKEVFASFEKLQEEKICPIAELEIRYKNKNGHLKNQNTKLDDLCENHFYLGAPG